MFLFRWRFWREITEMTKRLTKQSVDALELRSKAYVEYDADLRGFGVAVYPSRVKSWVCEYRPHAADAASPKSA
jgi:hypothetical protein